MPQNDKTTSALRRFFTMRHYYGDVVRQLFVAAGVVIFLLVPFVLGENPSAAIVIAAATLVLILFAGLTNPRLYWVALADAVVAGVGCLFFEALAIQIHALAGSFLNPIFLLLQLLAILFLFAFYFSIKTVRGMSVLDDDPRRPTPPSTESSSLYN